MRGRRLRDYLLVLTVVVLAVAAAAYFNRLSRESLEGIARVVDGDTLVLGERWIRLKDIDAPELEQECASGDIMYRCGEEAAAALKTLLSGRMIRCSGSDQDQYGRLLAYCSADGQDINAAMVLIGWAVAYGGYRSVEQTARKDRSGLWAGKFETPHEWRSARGMAVDTEPGGVLLRWFRAARRGPGFEKGVNDR